MPALQPTRIIAVSEWADQYRIIPAAGGAKEPGPWRTDRFPFLREIMDNMSPPQRHQLHHRRQRHTSRPHRIRQQRRRTHHPLLTPASSCNYSPASKSPNATAAPRSAT
ncbi:MAG: phage terminase large subunit family protein [Desulfobacterales bacterium]|nr:phage terminase large subunit family protein [Desulfobacterales bacterium]